RLKRAPDDPGVEILVQEIRSECVKALVRGEFIAREHFHDRTVKEDGAPLRRGEAKPYEALLLSQWLAARSYLPRPVLHGVGVYDPVVGERQHQVLSVGAHLGDFGANQVLGALAPSWRDMNVSDTFANELLQRIRPSCDCVAFRHTSASGENRTTACCPYADCASHNRTRRVHQRLASFA